MASTVSNGNDRSEKWQQPFTKGKFAALMQAQTEAQAQQSKIFFFLVLALVMLAFAKHKFAASDQ